LLETGRDLDAGAAGEEPMPVNHVVAAGSDIDRQDAARHCGGERDDPGRSLRGVGAHQQSPSADLALQRSHQPLSAYTAAHAGGHLDGVGHPGELADLGDDALTPVERNRQHRHGRAENLALHNRSFSLGALTRSLGALTRSLGALTRSLGAPTRLPAFVSTTAPLWRACSRKPSLSVPARRWLGAGRHSGATRGAREPLAYFYAVGGGSRIPETMYPGRPDGCVRAGSVSG